MPMPQHLLTPAVHMLKAADQTRADVCTVVTVLFFSRLAVSRAANSAAERQVLQYELTMGTMILHQRTADMCICILNSPTALTSIIIIRRGKCHTQHVQRHHQLTNRYHVYFPW
jgi:hypothetical protein